jgi:hypothetical protein
VNPFTPEILEWMMKESGIGCDGEAEEAEVESRAISGAFLPRFFLGMIGSLPGIRQGVAGYAEWNTL